MFYSIKKNFKYIKILNIDLETKINKYKFIVN